MLPAVCGNSNGRGGGRGFLLLEGALSVAIIIMAAVAITSVTFYGHRAIADANNLARAVTLATEGVEAVRDIRMANFTDLLPGNYGLEITADGQWRLSGGAPEIIDGQFSREIIITAPDSGRRRAEVVVNWPPGQEIRLITEFRNWLPTLDDWRNPRYGGDFDLTAANSGSNSHKVRTVKTAGRYLYAGNDHNGSLEKEFMVFDALRAPALQIKGTLGLDGSSRDMVIYQNFAYIASTSQTGELQTVNIGNPSAPTLVGAVNLSGNEDGLSVDVNPDTQELVIGRINKMERADVSSPASPVLTAGLETAGSNFNNVLIRGSTLFAARGNQLETYALIPNSDKFTFIDSLSLGGYGCSQILSLAVTATHLYAGCGGNGDENEPELFIGDATNPNSLTIIGTKDIGGYQADINDILHIRQKDSIGFIDLLILLTDDAGKEFQVFNVTDGTNAVFLSSLNLGTSPSQVAYSSLMRKMFIGTTSDPEIQIIAPDKVFDL